MSMGAMSTVTGQFETPDSPDLGASFYVCGPSMFGYGVAEDDLIVSRHTVAAVVTWADLLAASDIHVFSKAQFEKP